MFTKRMLTMATAMLAVSASAALAGTKYQANLVPASAVHPPANPTMESGKVSLKDSAEIKVKIKGVTDNAGDPVTGVENAAIDGTEYVLVIKATFTAAGIPIEAPVVMDLKNGGGKGAVSLAFLLNQLPAGTGRSIEVTGGEVWGPLGLANVVACTNEVATGFSLVGSQCKGGTKIGVAGINIP